MSSHQKADVILSGDAVFTGLSDTPERASIAIANNRIVSIGTEEDVKSYLGPNTKTYHFDEQLIMPGFHDFHLHTMAGALSLDSVNLLEIQSEEEAVKKVRDFADSRPEDSWIIGFSWDHTNWESKQLPHRSSLDQVLPDRPVLLLHLEGHYAWVNSKALELIEADDGKSESYGEIGRDKNGIPNGILFESAMASATKKAFDFSSNKRAQLFKGFLSEAARLGVTSINDMFGSALGMDQLKDFELFAEFEKNDKLTTRIHILPALDGDLNRAKQLRDKYQSSMLRFSGLKQFIDGVITSRTAYMLEPYSDKPETCGVTVYPPEKIKKWVKEADREGFRIRFHAVGDGAVRLALDAFEEAQQLNGIRDSRHTIEHIETIHPTDIPRFKELGVIASMQPDHLGGDEDERDVYVSFIGHERDKYTFPIKSLKDAGAKMAFGSDFPVVPLNPMNEIYRAVTRTDNDGLWEGWNPQECISLSEALKGYTLGPAYGTFREHELGTLEVGKLADIVVLDRNLFKVPVKEILETKVRMTMVDGDIVYQS